MFVEGYVVLVILPSGLQQDLLGLVDNAILFCTYILVQADKNSPVELIVFQAQCGSDKSLDKIFTDKVETNNTVINLT